MASISALLSALGALVLNVSRSAGAKFGNYRLYGAIEALCRDGPLGDRRVAVLSRIVLSSQMT